MNNDAMQMEAILWVWSRLHFGVVSLKAAYSGHFEVWVPNA